MSGLCGFMQAQMLNSGFENWTNMGSYDTPDNWGNLNSVTAPVSVFTCTKGTPGNPGASYIKLTSQLVLTQVVPGIAVSGVIDTATFRPKTGFPISTRPTNLTGKWQYMAFGTPVDQGYIAIILTKWNGSGRDTISQTWYGLPGMVMSWASFNISLMYQMPANPDTGFVILSASGFNGATPSASSYIWADNLAFSGGAGIEDHGSILRFDVYPNPSSGNINLSFTSAHPSSSTIQITDILGNVVKEEYIYILQGENNLQQSVSGLTKGIYFLKLNSDDGVNVRKVIVD